jgi:molybdopterin-guanine dinucleotide biosynthesis protein B
MPYPVVCIVGRSGVGKTTFIEKLLPELVQRGYRIATIKRASKPITFDKPEKDSYRHLAAGSKAVAISTDKQTVLLIPELDQPSLSEISRYIVGDYDLILVEGMKTAKTGKIEIHRKETGPLIENARQLLAVVTNEPLKDKVRQFGFEEITQVADFIEKWFIQPYRDSMVIYVNNQEVKLKKFPREFVENTIFSLIASLDGIDKIKSLEIRIKKANEEVV